MASSNKTVFVPHLGGIEASYRLIHPYDASKPTLVLVNSFATSSDLYKPQYEDETLAGAANLLSIEPLGHGMTRTRAAQWTYWDSAAMMLQVMDELGIEKVFALGTSQGGFIVTRMSLLAPHRVRGLILLGTSMDSESAASMRNGCWDAQTQLSTTLQILSSIPSEGFKVPEPLVQATLSQGFGPNFFTAENGEFWSKKFEENYDGGEGKERLIMSVINLRDRDSLQGRVSYVRCPVFWMQGSDDTIYPVKQAEEDIKLFTASSSANLEIVTGGRHFLSASHPREVNQSCLQFIQAHANPEPSRL
ncbi:alpha/beta fold family hydrolase [Atractiella rhizophila]|nr:alpha/beta fold family hydrolase [Atractiella rhizophila]